MKQKDFVLDFFRKLASGTHVYWVYLAGDEKRLEDLLQANLKAYNDNLPAKEKARRLDCHNWDPVHGASWGKLKADAKPQEVLESLRNETNGIYVLRDMALLLNLEGNVGLRRVLAELCKENQLNRRTADGREIVRPIVLASYDPRPHPSIAPYCDVLEFPLPDYEYLRQNIVGGIVKSLQFEQPKLVLDEHLLDRSARAMLGLTAEESTRILADAVTRAQGFSLQTIEHIADEKCKSLQRVEGLRYIPYRNIDGMDQIGGYDQLLNFVKMKARAYTPHARAMRMDKPRGLVLLGPPGTGKTRVAEALAQVLELDLISLNLSAMFSSLVGSTEKNIRTALQVIDGVRRALLVLDELDKCLAGSHKNQSLDSGVSSHMLSEILTWLARRDVSADSDSAIFVVVTMNRTAGVPPELLRPGRFDKIFFADLPNQRERLEILKIHLRKRGVDPEVYGPELDVVAGATQKFAGAELEQVIIDARDLAYDRVVGQWEQRGSSEPAPDATAVRPTLEDLLKVARGMVPTAVRDQEEIEEVCKTGRERATPVSSHSQAIEQVSQRRVSTHLPPVSGN